MDKIKHPKRFFVLLIVLATIGPVALNMPIPAMPNLIEAFKTTPDKAQLTLTLYLFGMGLSQIIMGPLSDRFGRRPIVLIGMALGTVCAFLASISNSIEMMIITRLLQAIGATSGVILGRAMIRDLYSQDKAASMMGYVTMGMMLGPMITPYFGGILTENAGWHIIFWVIAIMTAIAGGFAFLDLPETRLAHLQSKGFSDLWRDIKELASVKEFWLYCMVGSFSSAQFFAISGAVPYVTVNILGFKPSDYGAWVALTAVGYALGNYISGKFSVKKGIVEVMRWGSWFGIFAAFLTLSFCSAAIITKMWILFFPFFFMALSNGMQLPTSMAGALSVRPKIAGSAAGLNGFTQMTIGSVLSQITGMGVANYHSIFPIALALIFCALLASFAQRGLRQK